MRNFYLLAAVAGAVVPYLFFFDFFAAEGLDVIAFAGALFVNGAAGGFAADLLVTSVVFWVWLISQGERRAWLLIFVNLSVGLSCAVPLYLWMRAGVLDKPAPAP